MLARLICQNRNKKLSDSNNKRGGFIDRRTTRPRLLCGIHTFLHKKCGAVAFPKLTKKQFRERKKTPRKHRRGRSSSKRIGKYFHRQVHHALVCSSLSTACTCPEGETKAKVRKNSPAFEMVHAAKDFIRDERLAVLAGETVIAAPHVGLGTRFDLLGERLYGNAAGHKVLISWKTSGDCPFAAGTTRASLVSWVCRAVDKSTPSEFIIAREHLAQLSLEIYLLRKEHKVKVHEACIVYLTPNKREYRTIYVDGIKNRGYETVWEYVVALKQ